MRDNQSLHILSNAFASENRDWWTQAIYNAENWEVAIKSDKGLGEDLANTKLSDLNKKVGNHPNLRVLVTTVTYDTVTGSYDPNLIDSHDKSG